MADGSEARKAIEAANGLEVDGRSLSVNEARPKNKSDKRGGGRGSRNKGGGRRDW